MGCDYYIVKLLDVKYLDDHDDEKDLTIELDRQRCYFYEYDEDFDSDSDDTTNTDTFNRRYGKYLNVTYKPKVLFINNKWKNERIEDKYFSMIQSEIGNGLLISVIKKEERYLR